VSICCTIATYGKALFEVYSERTANHPLIFRKICEIFCSARFLHCGSLMNYPYLMTNSRESEHFGPEKSKKRDISVDVSGCLSILEAAESGHHYFAFSNRFRSPLSTMLRFIFSRAFYIQFFAAWLNRRINCLTLSPTPSLGVSCSMANLVLCAGEVSCFQKNGQTRLSGHLHRTRDVNSVIDSDWLESASQRPKSVRR
jgi:hypothetical protein